MSKIQVVLWLAAGVRTGLGNGKVIQCDGFKCRFWNEVAWV